MGGKNPYYVPGFSSEICFHHDFLESSFFIYGDFFRPPEWGKNNVFRTRGLRSRKSAQRTNPPHHDFVRYPLLLYHPGPRRSQPVTVTTYYSKHCSSSQRPRRLGHKRSARRVVVVASLLKKLFFFQFQKK